MVLIVVGCQNIKEVPKKREREVQSKQTCPREILGPTWGGGAGLR